MYAYIVLALSADQLDKFPARIEDVPVMTAVVVGAENQRLQHLKSNQFRQFVDPSNS